MPIYAQDTRDRFKVLQHVFDLSLLAAGVDDGVS